MILLWRYWWPDRGETEEDAREVLDRADRDVGFVARDIAERDWPSHDYWREDTIVVVDPDGGQHEIAIEVESVPNFIVRERPAVQRQGADPGKR